MAAKPSIDATFAGRRPGKPPLVNVQLDVTLQNPAADARWFLIPDNVPDSGPDDGGVTGVEPHEAKGEGRAVVGHFLGTKGFLAIQVAGGATVKLEKLTVRAWDESGWKGPLKLDVVVAKDVTVGGEPIAAWFGTTNPLSDARVKADVSKATRTKSRMTEDRGEVPVAIVEEAKIPLSIEIK